MRPFRPASRRSAPTPAPPTLAPRSFTLSPRADVALALGGGGVRGAAHFLVIEALDELGLTVGPIAGSSIGAIIGAMHAAGMSGRDIREHLVAVAGHPGRFARRLIGSRAIQLAGMATMYRSGWSPVDSRQLLAEFLPPDLPERIEDLPLSMTILATDIIAGNSLVLTSGDLGQALAASAAMPGLMRPVRHAGTVLIDGAVLEPVPVGPLARSGLPIVAVDLSGIALPLAQARAVPSAIATATLSLQMQARCIAARRLEETPPAVLIQPALGAIRPPDFHRAPQILASLAGFKDEAKRQIEAGLETYRHG